MAPWETDEFDPAAPRDSDAVAARNRKANRQAWLIVAAVLMPMVGCCAWGAFDFFYPPHVERQPFNSGRWKAISEYDRAGPMTRQYMAEDLIATQDLRGRSRSAVIELLGERGRNGFLSRDDVPRAFSYKLGPQFGVDDNWLLIQFDEDDRVVSASIMGD